jgi:methanobactin biosynthesis cassette protein MbnC
MDGLVVGWKCNSVLAGRQIELIKPEEALPPPADTFGYFTLSSYELTVFPGWRYLSR